MWRWIILIVFVLGAACDAPAPQGIELPLSSEIPSLEDAPQGIQAVLRQALVQDKGGYFVLQFNSLPDEETRRQLEQAGILLGDFVPENAYQAYLPPQALPTLEELMDDGKLRYAGPIPPEAKLQPELAANIEADPQASYEVVVQLFAQPPEQTMQQFESLMKVTGSSFGPVNIIEGQIKGSDIQTLLELPLVKWVEERTPADLGGG